MTQENKFSEPELRELPNETRPPTRLSDALQGFLFPLAWVIPIVWLLLLSYYN